MALWFRQNSLDVWLPVPSVHIIGGPIRFENEHPPLSEGRNPAGLLACDTYAVCGAAVGRQ